MENFMSDAEDMRNMRNTLGEIHDLIAEVHDLGRELLAAITSGEEWEGSANVAGAAFLSLVVELNRQLGSAEGGPVREAYEGVDEYLKWEAAFYDEWREYQEVEAIC